MVRGMGTARTALSAASASPSCSACCSSANPACVSGTFTETRALLSGWMTPDQRSACASCTNGLMRER